MPDSSLSDRTRRYLNRRRMSQQIPPTPQETHGADASQAVWGTKGVQGTLRARAQEIQVISANSTGQEGTSILKSQYMYISSITNPYALTLISRLLKAENYFMRQLKASWTLRIMTLWQQKHMFSSKQSWRIVQSLHGEISWQRFLYWQLLIWQSQSAGES